MFSAGDDLRLAHALADTADAIAIGYFRQPGVGMDIKPDGSPVTEADRLIEGTLRARLARHRRGDAFVGEESGSQGFGGRRWLVDPIDGTASFLAGRPEWGTLIALEDAGTVTVGLVTAPALRRRWWATRGGGAWTRRYGDTLDDEPARLAVTGTARLDRATVAIWPLAAELSEPLRTPAARLAACCGSVCPEAPAGGQPAAKPSTASGTCHGALLVGTGQVDAFLLTGGGPWDLAALVPIVEEAGGRFSDLAGGRALDRAAAIFTNDVMHDQVLRCLQRDPYSWNEVNRR